MCCVCVHQVAVEEALINARQQLADTMQQK